MFLLKKFIAPFFSPLSLCLIILIIGLFLLWFTRRQKAGKIVVSAGLLFLVITSYSFVFNFQLRSLETKFPALMEFGPVSDIRWVVALGGGHNSDPDLPLTSQISPA